MFRQPTIRICEQYHEYVHIIFGLISYLLFIGIFKAHPSIVGLSLALVGSILPDIDHLFFLFIYGRHTHYAQAVTGYLKTQNLQKALDYCRTNHKSNHFIISHNLITPLFFLIISLIVPNSYLKILFFSMTFHFVFDILEDLLVFGRLNPNWYLQFTIT